MKNLILLLILSSMNLVLLAQKETDYIYLYDQFQQGTLKYKNGNTSPGIFNYELLSGEILFKDNNTILELAYPDKVESIQIGKDTFIHIKGRLFYQKIDLGNINLYVKHAGSLRSKGKNVGYGYSQTASADNLSRFDAKGYSHKNLDRDEISEVDKKNYFYIKINGKFKHIHSAGSLAKLFKGHEKDIKEAIKEDTDFQNIEDVMDAVKLCGELLEK